MVLFNPLLRGGVKKVHTFNKGISQKVNVMAQVAFELAYDHVAIQHISHYTERTPQHAHTAYYNVAIKYVS